MLPKISTTNTLGDVYRCIAGDQDLAQHQRSQRCSAINIFAMVAGKSPDEIIAEPTVIRALREKSAWKLAGLTKKRWANILSLITDAMKRAGIKVHRSRRNFPLDEDWEQLLARNPHKTARHGLTRFAGWCSMKDIAPVQVTVEVFYDYQDYLKEASIQVNPRERWHVARRAWNKAVTTVEGWPQVHIPVGETERWTAIPWEDFPEGLQDELAAYRTHVTREDHFDDDHKAIKPVSVDNYIARLKVLASLLVKDGVPIEQFDTLCALLEPELVKHGLDLIVGDRTFKKAKPTVMATINAVLSAARYLDLPEEYTTWLRTEKMMKEVRRVESGMTEKNKERLAPLKDDTLRQRFYMLPLLVMRRMAKIKNPTIKQALRFQIALVMEILINAPLRIKNLAALDREKHIYRPLNGAAEGWRIFIPKEEVKNGVELNFPLTPETGEMMELYLKTFRPVLCSGPCSSLFVSQKGTQKGSSALSRQLRRFIKAELGLEFNAHLMRHFAGFAHLKKYPGEYETVRRLLGHKDIRITIAFYSGLETEDALNRYDAMIREQRGLTDERDYL